MKWKHILCLALVLICRMANFDSVSAAEVRPAPAASPAYVSRQTVCVDGKAAELQMYALRDGDERPVNYIRARDLAYVLDGTKAQFDVVYHADDKTIDLIPGAAYTPNGFELQTPFSGDQPYAVCTGTTRIGGALSNVSAIRLTDGDGAGYTYYALRELAWELGFTVGWSKQLGVTIETDKAPQPAYDAAPASCGNFLTVDGESMGTVFAANELLYVRLPEADVTTSRPSGQKTSRGTDYYFADAAHRNRALQFDNNSSRFSCAGESVDLPAPPLYDGKFWYVPLRAFYTGMGFTEYDDAEQNHLYYTLLPDVNAIPGGRRVPILMYHAVSDQVWNIRELFVSPGQMEKQLQYLNKNGFTTIFFSDLPNLDNIKKPVLLTFDDGYDDNYTCLFPLLKKYNCKATIFMIGNTIATRHSLTYAQLQEMTRSGLVDIQSHTASHRNLDRLGEKDTVYEMQRSQLILLRTTGRQPYVVCYPSGKNSALTRRVARDYYLFGVQMNGGRYATGTDRFQIPRVYVSRDTGIGAFAGLVS